MLHNPFKSHDDHGNASKPASDQEQSLTTVLSTADQRSDLTLLLASCISAMRKTITDIFDPRYTGGPSDSRYDNPTQTSKLDSSQIGMEQLDKERVEAEKRIKELSEEEMQTLKTSALNFFDKWRDGVLGRVGEVVNSRKEATKQGEQREEDSVDHNAPDTATKKLEPEKINTKAKTARDDQEDTVAKALEAVYPPIKTPLLNLDEEQRTLILHSIMLLLLSLEHYAAHSRVLLLYLANSLHVNIKFLAEDEGNIARGLLKAAESMNADDEKKKKADENSNSRKWKVGLATVAGAAVIGLTGGLAAPLVAAGIGTVMGGIGLAETAAAVYLGSVAGSTLIVGSLFGAYGGRMTGKMMDEYAREVEDFGFLPIHRWSQPREVEKEYRRLRVAIGISGWLTDKEEVLKPWRILSPSIEGFALKYEVESLLSLGNAMTSLVSSTAWTYAKKEIIRRTIFATLKEALWPLMILKVAKIVDNPFSVAKSRSDKAGEVLADALINKAQGERPVSLIGYSLGARVIYTCLKSLADRKAFGLIENVVLLGCPAPSDSADWRKMRSVVSGRLVNVYSENDYILAFLYRTSSIQFGVAGLRPAEYVKGVENVDVSDIVSGHLRYRYLTGAILHRIGLEDIDIQEVEQEEEELKEIVDLEEKESKENLEKHERGKSSEEQQIVEMEKEVQKKNEQSTMDWASAKLHLGKESATSIFGGWGAKEQGVKVPMATARK